MERRRFLKQSGALRRNLQNVGLGEHVHGLVLQRPLWGRSIVFQSLGPEDLTRFLERSQRFCRDRRLGRALHPRGTSFREIESHPGLHLSVQTGGLLTVHLDRSTPAVGINPDGACAYSNSEAARHMWRDVLPSLGSRGLFWKTMDRGEDSAAPRIGYRRRVPVAQRTAVQREELNLARVTGGPTNLTYWSPFHRNRAPP